MAIKETTCLFLFGKSAEEIFKNQKFNPTFTDQCLETLISVHCYMLSRKETFFLCDPCSFNNQCHLFSLRTVKIQRSYKDLSREERLTKNEANRFLHLTLFLSFAFLNDSNLLTKVIEVNAAKAGISLPTPSQKFIAFVKDNQGERVRAARLALNEQFKNHLSILLAKENSSLMKELLNLAAENLHLAEMRDKTPLYTFPKLAGVAYMVDIIAREKIHFSLKIKVITKEGSGTLQYNHGIAKDPSDPVIVFEAFATDGSLTIKDCQSLAKHCNSHFLRMPSSKSRHSETTSCLFCTASKIDLKPYQERLNLAVQDIAKMFYALGADFIQHEQKSFLPLFQDEKKYPELTSLFNHAITDIDLLGLSMEKPFTFSVNHVYPDIVKYGFSSQLLMEKSSEEIFRLRGLL